MWRNKNFKKIKIETVKFLFEINWITSLKKYNQVIKYFNLTESDFLLWGDRESSP